jgi:hypothetical protein
MPREILISATMISAMVSSSTRSETKTAGIDSLSTR